MSAARPATAFLLDVDNTLLDNDRVVLDLQQHLEQEVGADRALHYWDIFEQLRNEVGYADYLGALQGFRAAYPRDESVLAVSRFLLAYPFAERLYPGALAVIAHVAQWGPVAILTDGDVVFQPRKIDHAGLSDAVDGRVYIYLHKEHELDDLEARLPADRYVIVEDKLRILAAVKQHWGSRVTTAFVQQGHYANDPKLLAEYAPADVSLDHIGDLRHCTLAQLRRE